MCTTPFGVGARGLRRPPGFGTLGCVGQHLRGSGRGTTVQRSKRASRGLLEITVQGSVCDRSRRHVVPGEHTIPGEHTGSPLRRAGGCCHARPGGMRYRANTRVHLYGVPADGAGHREHLGMCSRLSCGRPFSKCGWGTLAFSADAHRPGTHRRGEPVCSPGAACRPAPATAGTVPRVCPAATPAHRRGEPVCSPGTACRPTLAFAGAVPRVRPTRRPARRRGEPVCSPGPRVPPNPRVGRHRSARLARHRAATAGFRLTSPHAGAIMPLPAMATGRLASTYRIAAVPPGVLSRWRRILPGAPRENGAER